MPMTLKEWFEKAQEEILTDHAEKVSMSVGIIPSR